MVIVVIAFVFDIVREVEAEEEQGSDWDVCYESELENDTT